MIACSILECPIKRKIQNANYFLNISQVAAEIAAPLSRVEKITMVSNGSSEVGAAKITGELLDIVIRMPQVMEQLTGVDIAKVPKHSSIFFDFFFASSSRNFFEIKKI